MSITLRVLLTWTSTVSVSCVAWLLLPAPSHAQARVIENLSAGIDFQGRVQRVVFDPANVPWIATTDSIYSVVHGTVGDVESVRGVGSRLELLPGGELYARLDSDTSGRFGVQLRDLRNPGRVIGTLNDAALPRGFTTLHAGRQGHTIVTATPLQNAEGLDGDFVFAFWSEAGSLLANKTLAGPRIGVTDESGQAILLIGRTDAIAFSSDGTELWRVAGTFRKGALAGRGMIGLLNPSKEIEEVHVSHAGRVTVATMPGPVHEMTLTPDGSIAAIATNLGNVTTFEVQTCQNASCRLEHMQPFQLGSVYFVTAVRFISKTRVALGVIEQSGSPPSATYHRGHVMVASKTGVVELDQPLRLAPGNGWSPLLDVTFNAPVFAAYTADSVIIVEVN